MNINPITWIKRWLARDAAEDARGKAILERFDEIYGRHAGCGSASGADKAQCGIGGCVATGDHAFMYGRENTATGHGIVMEDAYYGPLFVAIPPGFETLTPADLPRLLDEYMEKPANINGSSLHIYIEDGNNGDRDIYHCIKSAQSIGDTDAVTIGLLLMKITEAERSELTKPNA